MTLQKKIQPKCRADHLVLSGDLAGTWTKPNVQNIWYPDTHGARLGVHGSFGSIWPSRGTFGDFRFFIPQPTPAFMPR
jgi:hypothetical protein